MVYESRPGETFVLGASTWRIEEITHDRVVVTPAPGEPAKMPFWKGDKPGTSARARTRDRRNGARAARHRAQERDATRPLDLLQTRLLARRARRGEPPGVPRRAGRGRRAPFRTTARSSSSASATRSATGACASCPRSAPACTRRGRWRCRRGSPNGWDRDLQILWSDDGIILRLGEAFDDVPIDELMPVTGRGRGAADVRAPEHGDVRERCSAKRPRARCCCRGAVRTGARRCGSSGSDRPTSCRSRRSYPTFPILLETTRECVRDVFDLPALKEVLRDVRSRKVRVASVETKQASPFAQSLLFGWIAVYMYEGDTPPAERRAAALALDQDLLRELLGTEELRELIDPEALASIELDLQASRTDGARATLDELHDLLRRDRRPHAAWRSTSAATATRRRGSTRWSSNAARSACRVAGEERIAAAEDAARLPRRARRRAPDRPPAGVHRTGGRSADRSRRTIRAHARAVPRSRRRGALRNVAVDRVVRVARAARRERPDRSRRVPSRRAPSASGATSRVLRQLRRRSLARLRKEVEAVDPSVLGRFLPAWQSVTSPREGPDALVDTISQLQGAAIPASVLESDVLAVASRRVPSGRSRCAVRVRRARLGGGRVARPERTARSSCSSATSSRCSRRRRPDERPSGRAARRDPRASRVGGRVVLARPRRRPTGTADEKVLLPALWDLVWSGEVTNDTLAPLRALAWGKRRSERRRAKPRPGSLRRAGPPTGAGRWSLVDLRAASRADARSHTRRRCSCSIATAC